MQGPWPSPHLSTASLGKPRNDHIASAFNPSHSLTAVRHSDSWKFQLPGIIDQLVSGSESAFPTGQQLRLNFDSHHYLFMAIYLLSNKHLTPDSSEKERMYAILEMVFKLVSRRVLLAMIQSRLPSIRAAWEQLLLGAGAFKYKEAFIVLIKAGMDNDWLKEDSRGHELLYSAIRNDCMDLVDVLLARGCRADSSCGSWQKDTAIMEALENGNLDCARLLIRHCDVNREFRQLFGHENKYPNGFRMASNFFRFITNFDVNNTVHHHCLGYFLENGSDVDYNFNHFTVDRDTTGLLKSLEGHGFTEDWPCSILDYVFYLHRPIFPKLAVLSRNTSLLSRSGALWCFEKGIDVLRDYLLEGFAFPRPWKRSDVETGGNTSAPERKNDFLKMLLAEQFLLGSYHPNREVCYMTVKGILELLAGENLTSLSTKQWLAQDMLFATACLKTSGGMTNEENGSRLLQMLLDQGFQVQSRALSLAIERGNFATLECLAECCSDLKTHGADALAIAVSNNDFEQTKFLLDGGVDPNSRFKTETTDKRGLRSGGTIFAAASIHSTLSMMKYLIQRGAKPRTKENERDAFIVLLHILISADDVDLFAKVQYIIEEHLTIGEPSCPSAYLLEACLWNSFPTQERRRIFEYIFKKGAKLGPGSPLAQWIGAGGGHQLAREMLDGGADPNAYCSETIYGALLNSGSCQTPLQAAAGLGDYDLVCLLLERGADLNGRWPVDLYAMTALQRVCAWDPVRPEERMRKEKIVKLLLDKGAEVDDKSSYGCPALIHAASLGDLSTAFLLLKYGANVNAVVVERSSSSKTALDVAASHGRLDMVEFLLNSNARSIDGSNNEYSGAIENARIRGHFAVAELICKHAAARKSDWGFVGEQTAESAMPDDTDTQQPAIRGGFRAADDREAHTQVCYSLTSDIDDSKADSGAKGTENSGIVPSDLSFGELHDGTADQCLYPRGVPTGQGGLTELCPRGGQNWYQDEQQNAETVISIDLATDVFMGFTEDTST